MELSSTIAHTSSSDDFGKGFAFPQINLDAPRANGQEIPLTREEIALAASATPEGVDYAYNSGEFHGISDLEAEGIASEVIDTPITDGFTDGVHTPDDAFGTFTGFDPGRADLFAEEVGEELVGLAQELARELGADADPAEFLAELRKRQTELHEDDYEVALRARRLGAMANPEREAGAVCRLADHGEVHLRMVNGELLLVPLGADPQAVEEAAQRSRDTRLAKVVRPHEEAERAARLTRSKDRKAARRFEAQIRSNMFEASRHAKAGTLIPDARAEAIEGLRAFRKVWAGLPDERKALIPDPKQDAGLKRAFARAASSRAAEARFKKRWDLGKAFPAPMVPFGGTPVKPEEREEVLYIERLKATARELAEAQPDSPAAKTARAITRRSRVFAFYGDAQGVAHAAPAEPWFERTTVIFDPEGVFATRRSRSLADLVEAATESLFGEGSSVTVKFDPNAWADQLPEADRESGPDQRGASAPREYADAHRRDAVLHTATGRTLNPARNAGQQAAAVKRVAAALKRGEGISPSERAWRTALSIHLGETEDPAERLLLMLQSRGRRKWADLESGAANPGELKAAARELADAGRLKLLRGRTSGARYIEANEALEGEKRAELERALLRLMVTGRVAVPKGTRLARRVAAHKGWMAREAKAQSKAQSKAQANAQANLPAA